MIKISLIFVLVLFFFGCAPEPKPVELSDDYVLIEFAARLEEDYPRIYPQPEDSNAKSPTE